MYMLYVYMYVFTIVYLQYYIRTCTYIHTLYIDVHVRIHVCMQLIKNFHGQMETFKESAALKIAEARKLVIIFFLVQV